MIYEDFDHIYFTDGIHSGRVTGISNRKNKTPMTFASILAKVIGVLV